MTHNFTTRTWGLFTNLLFVANFAPRYLHLFYIIMYLDVHMHWQLTEIKDLEIQPPAKPEWKHCWACIETSGEAKVSDWLPRARSASRLWLGTHWQVWPHSGRWPTIGWLQPLAPKGERQTKNSWSIRRHRDTCRGALFFYWKNRDVRTNHSQLR